MHEAIFKVSEVAMRNGTPFPDMKPYVPQLNSAAIERIGWFNGAVTDLRRKHRR